MCLKPDLSGGVGLETKRLERMEEWKKDDWWNGWWSGWHDRSWKEETQTPLEEADRRKWEIQEEIEVR